MRIFIIGLLLSGCAASAAAQQVRCAPLDVMRRVMLQVHQERIVSVGMMSDGNALAMFAAPSGTWTAMIVRADGTACVVADGTDYTETPRGRDL